MLFLYYHHHNNDDYNLPTDPAPIKTLPTNKKKLKKLSYPAPTLHITNKNSKLHNTFLHTNLFRSDSIGNNNLDSANKTNLSDNDNHNKFNPIHPKHPSNT